MLEFLPSFQMLDQFGGTLGYSDGDVEERLLALFSDADEQEIAQEIERILQNNPSWPERVHLSPQRQHLLDWYPFRQNTAVLEYAGRYVQPQADRSPMAPYQQFLRDIHAILAPGGTLLLAIENQLGAKYLAGGAEDHYGQPLVGVEDYIADAGIRTFGKNELQRLIAQAGLQVVRFYYPVPDYKLPTAVYSDDLPPGSIDHISLLYPSVDFAYPHGDYFDEGRFMHAVARNGLATMFANAFLVECQL